MAADFLLQGETISRLLVGLSVTLRISLVSVALSLPMGVLMGVLFTRRNPCFAPSCASTSSSSA